MTTYDQLGKQVHKRREKMGLSRKAVVDRVEGVKNQKTLQSLELGQHRPRLDVFLCLVQALGGEVKLSWSNKKS